MDILSNLCRACNTEQKNVQHIFKTNDSTNIAKMLEYCTNITPSDDIKYPPWICFNCVKQLEICYRFLKRFKVSQNEFEVAFSHLNEIKESQSDRVPVDENLDKQIGGTTIQLKLCTKDSAIPIVGENVKSEEPVIELTVEYMEPSPTDNNSRLKKTVSDNIPDPGPKTSPAIECSICRKIFFTTKALHLHLILSHKQKAAIS